MTKIEQEIFDSIKAALTEQNPHAILFDGYEAALIGYVGSTGSLPVACYDYEKCIEILMKRDKMSREEAVEYFEFNSAGGYYGSITPSFLYT